MNLREAGRKAMPEGPTERSPSLSTRQPAFTYNWVRGFTTQGWGPQVPLCGRHCARRQGLLPHLSHLELSRPCDLRKFLSRFLDKNATSSSFVLVREGNLCSSVPVPEQMPSSTNDLHLLDLPFSQELLCCVPDPCLMFWGDDTCGTQTRRHLSSTSAI